MNNENKKKTVYLGMSGGVDSSVSAVLLLEAGFNVVGVFIKVWQPVDGKTGEMLFECTSKEDRLDAMRVCAKLGIPFKDLDLEKEYKKEVIDYMVSEYKLGKTPNPDVMCNKYIKFGKFYNWAIKQGADYVATGHYSRVTRHVTRDTKNKTRDNNSLSLRVSCDMNKDQTYFLWTLKQEQLSRIIFPVGGLKKDEVRKIAEKNNLPVAKKKDSQGLCFVGKVDFSEFLKNFIKEKKGKVLDENRKIIGSHNGAVFLTIGQRHGFSVDREISNSRPLYIISKDIKKNTITVSENKITEDNRNSRIISIENTNWISEVPQINKVYKARIRYRQPLENCILKKINKDLAVFEFEKKQIAITQGQSLVLYDNEICLGGGIITH